MHLCKFGWRFASLVIFGLKQMEKIPIDDIKKELRSAELSEEVIEELLQVLSVKSLEKLEGLVTFNILIFIMCKIMDLRLDTLNFD